MTYIDKYMKLHPTHGRERVMRHNCPNQVFCIEGEPVSYCTFSHTDGGFEDCRMCWLRTYRGEEELEV